MADLLAFLRDRYDEDERLARAAEEWHPSPWRYTNVAPKRDAIVAARGGEVFEFQRHREPTAHAVAFAERHDPASVLADIAAKRAILEEHAPAEEHVEWWDAPETGKALVCSACANREPNEWDLGVGNYGTKPDGWVSAYVLAPCRTVRLLAQPYAGHPAYRPEWTP